MKDKIRYIQFIVIGFLLLYLLWPYFVWMIDQWENNPNYGHGYLIPIACIYLIFRKRNILKQLPDKPSISGIFLILLGLVIYFIGIRIEFKQVVLFSFLVMVLGVIDSFWGKEGLKELVFPVGYFVFCIPMPYTLESLTVPLKLMASIVSTNILHFFGFMVAREGNIIQLPNYTLEVATACSGLKSLVLVTAVGALYAYITQPTLKRKWSLFLLSIPIAVCANISRIVIVGMLAAKFGERIAFNFVHDFSGIFVFIVAGALLALCGVIIEWIVER